MRPVLISVVGVLLIAVGILRRVLDRAEQRGYKRGREEGYEKGFAEGKVRADLWWINSGLQVEDTAEKIRQQERWL